MTAAPRASWSDHGCPAPWRFSQITTRGWIAGQRSVLDGSTAVLGVTRTIGWNWPARRSHVSSGTRASKLAEERQVRIDGLELRGHRRYGGGARRSPLEALFQGDAQSF